MSAETGPGPEFLKQKYDLQNSPEVQVAAERSEARNEHVGQSFNSRIQNYLDRFKEITEREDSSERERLMGALKNILYKNFVIKPEEIPEGYYENQQRLAREQGHGDIEITEDMREQLADVIVTDQKSSLDNWIDYLSSKDATYPDWLKYFAFRSITQMGGFDKERHSFSKRSKGTTKPFPDLNREALAYVLDAVERKYQGRPIDSLEGEEKAEFEKLLTSENFSKLYAWAIEKVTPASVEQITITKGKWVRFPQGTDPTTYIPEGFDRPLVQSLQGHGTGWCTAGESTAKTQLENGDFYVYYSIDPQGKPIIPRSAIRMQGDQIGEVRGIAAEQNLDPYITDVVDQKLQEFPDGKAYEKKNADMKQLTWIERKMKLGEQLSKADLVFLYEIDSKIEGFGYQRDPRIAELRSQRDPHIDAPIVFDCQPEQIAWSQDQIIENTKVYIGEWNIEVFQKIRNYPDIKHIYESFPDKKIFMQTLETDPSINSAEMAEQALKDKNDYLSDWGKDILKKTEFSKESQKYDLVRFTVSQLGFPNGATTDEIYARATELGLELCPAEVGPHLRLQYRGGEWMLIAMKQITDRSGYPDVFNLSADGGQLALNGFSAESSGRWRSDDGFVFRYRKDSQESQPSSS